MTKQNSRKGQAALEFLTTYGWAFLVILVMVGALYYFGVFDVSGRVPESCSLDGRVSCGDVFALDSTSDNFSVLLTNVGSRSADISEIKLTQRDGATDCTYTFSPTESIAAGANKEIIAVADAACIDAEMAGQKATFDIAIKYTAGGTSIEQVSQGTLTVRVQ